MKYFYAKSYNDTGEIRKDSGQCLARYRDIIHITVLIHFLPSALSFKSKGALPWKSVRPFMSVERVRAKALLANYLQILNAL